MVFAVALDHFGSELFNLNNTTMQSSLIIGIINVDHVDATITASQSDGALKYIEYKVMSLTRQICPSSLRNVSAGA